MDIYKPSALPDVLLLDSLCCQPRSNAFTEQAAGYGPRLMCCKLSSLAVKISFAFCMHNLGVHVYISAYY